MTGTGAIALAVAAAMPGTLAHEVAAASGGTLARCASGIRRARWLSPPGCSRQAPDGPL
ncbi:protein of unknown function [Paraburkholderia dioscoreae]|uniref:Uncharacterized protein n=1 Tax=Paraburkholderia dioscoreae TaxID=2604047 RepID=A0A5Q4YTD7_9BURK|nr:protein of unknown function [Paraburkholderia dioscoreae]